MLVVLSNVVCAVVTVGGMTTTPPVGAWKPTRVVALVVIAATGATTTVKGVVPVVELQLRVAVDVGVTFSELLACMVPAPIASASIETIIGER